MTKTLFLAWQDKRRGSDGQAGTRLWYPIGRLDAEPGCFKFRYTQRIKPARLEAGFQPLDAFPDLTRVYESAELFSLFKNRVPSEKRADYPAMLERLGLSKAEGDPFEILAVTGGVRQTDSLEVFPLNPPPAPHNQRVLVALSGQWPAGMEPVSFKDFQALVA